MKIEADGFSFSFPDARSAFRFDEKDSTRWNFHGAPMKAVDLIVEFDKTDLYIEIKDFHDPQSYNILEDASDAPASRQDHFTWLKNYLKYKYRDSYLFRYAEDKTRKPVNYICLLSLENALNSIMKKSLERELPVGIVSPRWKRAIAQSCQVLNLQTWNEVFPKWPAKKV